MYMPVSEARETKRRMFEFDRARKIATNTAKTLQPRPDSNEALYHAHWLRSLHRSKYNPHHDGADAGPGRLKAGRS